jgi:hypothetical protein
MLKLLSTEFDEATIQLTYTGGEPMDEAKEAVLVRAPYDGDVKHSLLWFQMDAMRNLREWADSEFRRLRDLSEKN